MPAASTPSACFLLQAMLRKTNHGRASLKRRGGAGEDSSSSGPYGYSQGYGQTPHLNANGSSPTPSSGRRSRSPRPDSPTRRPRDIPTSARYWSIGSFPFHWTIVKESVQPDRLFMESSVTAVFLCPSINLWAMSSQPVNYNGRNGPVYMSETEVNTWNIRIMSVTFPPYVKVMLLIRLNLVTLNDRQFK